jgi:uroporphyrinogen-III decarboxylase
MSHTPFSKMTSRERVIAAMKGRPQDRVPVFYWINPHAAGKLMSTLQPARDKTAHFMGTNLWKWFAKKGFEGSDLQRGLPLLLDSYANSEYVLELGGDIALLSVSDDSAVKKTYFEKGKLKVLDGWGNIRGIGGIYADVTIPAIQSLEDLEKYQFQPFHDEKGVAKVKKYRAAHPDTFMMGASFGVQDLFFTQLWTMQDAMLALVDHPKEVKAFQKRMAEWDIDLAVCNLRAGADGVLIYEDYGYTNRTMISVEMWKEFTFPHLKRIISAIHEEGGLAMLHSCGYQMPLLPYYVEAGLDALQTFQPKAGNDFQEAYSIYGDQLTFSTGIDIQLGELMTPEELRHDITIRYHIGKAKNRFILGTTHELQFTMPVENMRMIFKTVQEIQQGTYK